MILEGLTQNAEGPKKLSTEYSIPSREDLSKHRRKYLLLQLFTGFITNLPKKKY